MECEKIRKVILENPETDIDKTQLSEIKIHIKDCKECTTFYEDNRGIWKLLDIWEPLVPEKDYVTKFWKKISEENLKNTGGIQKFIKNLRLSLMIPPAFAILFIVGIISFNFINDKNNYIVFTEIDRADEELLLNIESAITSKTTENLQIYGLWEENIDDIQGG